MVLILIPSPSGICLYKAGNFGTRQFMFGQQSDITKINCTDLVSGPLTYSRMRIRCQFCYCFQLQFRITFETIPQHILSCVELHNTDIKQFEPDIFLRLDPIIYIYICNKHQTENWESGLKQFLEASSVICI